MLVIVAAHRVNEDLLDEYRNKAKELVEKSREEAGCISYDLLQDSKDKCALCFVEKWEDQKAFDAHRESAHYKGIGPELAKMREGETVVNIYREF